MYLWFKLLHIFFCDFLVCRTVLSAADLCESGAIRAWQRGICTADGYVAQAVPLYVAFGLGNADIWRGHRVCQQLVGQRLAGG